MVNARGDERLPRSAVDALYASAREPKELIWMSGGHVHGDKETIQRLVAIVSRSAWKLGAAGDRALRAPDSRLDVARVALVTVCNLSEESPVRLVRPTY